MPGFWGQAAIEQVQAANNIVDVVSEYVALTRKGGEMVGLCPFHDDHRPSLYVNESKQIFKCFACGAGGDVLKFVQLKEGLTFPEAVERLAERAGIRLRSPLMQRRSVAGLDRSALAKVNRWAAMFFQSCLADKVMGRQAREYLAQRMVSQASIESWRLGYAPADRSIMIGAARKQGISEQVLRDAGLVDSSGQVRFAGRLIFPICDVSGTVVGFGARTLSGDPVKYINSPNTVLFNKGSCLYGLAAARHAIVQRQCAVVVEGYTDCIMAHQVGCNNVVATLGTSLTSDHGRILRRYAKMIILVFDGDQAGQAASNRALEVCLRHRIDVRIATIPQGDDPCEFLIGHGKEAFEQLISQAVDVLAYKWQQLERQLSSDDSWAGRRSAIEDFLQTVATAASAGQISIVDRGLLVNRLARILSLEPRQVDAELSRRMEAAARGQSTRQMVPGQQGLAADRTLRTLAEREVIEVILNAPELFDQVRDVMRPDDFIEPRLKAAAELLFSYMQEYGHAEPGNLAKALLARTESLELGSLIAEMAQQGQRKGNFRLRLNGALEVLRRGRDGAAAAGGNRRSLGLI
ncbi:MAG: DNA primase [Sedimentisphaerales bacterium]|nr:DNA primase [Sedimentisphaerales bacterium]